MYSFKKISSIDINKPKTWEKKQFLSFDIDWAHDEILNDTYELLIDSGYKSTWFVSHKSSYITQLRSDKNIELGVHPNFNNLFTLESKFDADKILEDIKTIVPEAVSLRSHSLTQNERLLDKFKKFGFTHISNCYIPYSSKIILRPFSLWDDIIIVPHQHQDNVEIKMQDGLNEKKLICSSYRVFNFHPIHIFLNTESINRYESTRHLHHSPKELIKYRFKGRGTRTDFLKLLEG